MGRGGSKNQNYWGLLSSNSLGVFSNSPGSFFFFFKFPMLLKQPTYIHIFLLIPVIFSLSTHFCWGVVCFFLVPEVFVGSKVSTLDPLMNLNPFPNASFMVKYDGNSPRLMVHWLVLGDVIQSYLMGHQGDSFFKLFSIQNLFL